MSDTFSRYAESSLSNRFFEDLVRLGLRRGSPPHIFLSVWCVESGLLPSAINAHSGARGLNQMMPATLKALGAPMDFEKLSAEEQLPWIERLIASLEHANGGPFTSAARYYHANFFPRTMHRGDRPDAVVVARDAADPDERGAYEANRGLDANRDGLITLSDLATVLERTKTRFKLSFAQLALAMQVVRMRDLAPTSTPDPPSPTEPWTGLLLLGLGLTALAIHNMRRTAA
jgi:hypothetical protein